MLHLHNILNGVWLMEPGAAVNYMPLVTSWLKGNPIAMPANAQQRESYLAQNNGYHVYSRSHVKNAPEGTVAIISISGIMTKHDQDCGPVGMLTKIALLKECYANENIKGVIFDIDSPGGEAYAALDMYNAIAERNKPVIAFANGGAFSAAYIGFAGCDLFIAANEMIQVGSIGTYRTIVDYRKQLEMEGISLTDVYATKSIDKNAEFRAAIDGDTSLIQKRIDYFNENFTIKSVAEGRKGKVGEEKEWGTGKTFFAPEALKLGLIDGIDTLENVIQYFKT